MKNKCIFIHMELFKRRMTWNYVENIYSQAEHDGDSDSDMNDSESIAGSEASSTTASLRKLIF